MNEGVKILLERMKTNPEEFIVSEGYPYEVGSGSKWHRLIESHKLYLNSEDNKVLEEALNGLMQQRFTERVMKELLAPEEDDDMGKWFTKRGSATVSATPIPAISSITLEQNEHLRAQVNAMKVEVRKKPTIKKPHQTLFGKLFNYS